MIAPQCPGDNTIWEKSICGDGKGDAPLTIADEILDAFIREFPVDENKMGIIGVCAGGQAAWSHVSKNPNRFAALASFTYVVRNLPVVA